MTTIRKIAVIGATGMLGKPVTRAPLDSGYAVTALVRDLTKAQAELPAGIALIKGDIRNLGDVAALLRGQDALYLNLNLRLSDPASAWHPEREGLDTILPAAREAGIQRIGLISSVVKNYQGMNGFHWWVFDMKQQAVERIKASGIPYTIFYPSTFMENFETTYRRGRRILLAGRSKHPMYFIAGDDYGRQVARSFQLAACANKDYVVQGPDAFTADEAAAVYIRHHRREKLVITRSPHAVLKFLGRFSHTIDYGQHIIEALNEYPEKFEASETWETLGKPVVTLPHFAAR